MDQDNPYDFTIRSLGECTVDSPLNVSYYTTNDRRVLFNVDLYHYADLKAPDGQPLSVEVAGPRAKIFYDPAKTKAAIVTCGGLCPGINDVIRAVVMELYHRYGKTLSASGTAFRASSRNTGTRSLTFCLMW
jgi:6-phosphofructokinase 1